jgi:hypothetical protein
MQEEVDVRVDESGKQGRVAEIDDLGARRVLDGRADFDDVVTLDSYLAGCDNPASLHFDQPRGVQDNRAWRLREQREPAQCDDEDKSHV